MENNGTGSLNCGQAFQIQTAGVVCAFSLYGGKGTVGTQPGTFKVEILSGSYTSGTVIATTGILSSALMADYTSPAWYKFEFESTVSLDVDTTYYLKSTQLSGSTNDVIRWFCDTTSPSYAYGNDWRDNVEVTSQDRLFRVHGTSGTTYTLTLTETVGASDTFARAVSRALSETVSVAATFSHVWTLARTLTESITLAQSFLRTVARTFSETIAAADTLIQGKPHTAGPNSPTSGTNDDSVGDVAWTDPGNITASDASYATATLSSQTSEYLKATGFGFDIPSSATIQGIKVEIEKAASGTITDNAVRIVKSDGSIGTTDKSDGSDWPSTETYTTYGSSTDLWGESWTADDINDSDFGVVISATN